VWFPGPRGGAAEHGRERVERAASGDSGAATSAA